jgi:hypothetical protein
MFWAVDLTDLVNRCLWFLAFDTHIELHPAMNLEDLKKATPGIERAVKNYGREASPKAA